MKTKWHLKVYSCAHQTIYSRCVADTSSQFRRTMWQFIFDTSRYSRAATYLCRAHNLRIFQTYKDSCLIPYEQEVQFCSEQYSSLLSATTVRLATNNPSNLTNEDSYAEYMKKELTHAYCLGITEKLNCISSILHKHCSSDITELIRNYFRETLPTDCEPHLLANRDNSSYAQNTRRTTRKLGKSRTDFQNIAPVGEGGRTRSAVAAASKSKGLRPQILQIVSFRTPLKFLISHSSATVILAVVWDVYQFVL
ncbi:unnamed protein product [Calicophoron daubneyi]|uniref:Uncharacterized protein n=1 Tax=Calicophoron daubneyi TaxID=300641 RepID=A0AAV2TPC3_CALDB